MPEIELGAIALPLPGRGVAAARAAEQDGYDVALLADSQNLHGEVYTELALASEATTRIRLGTGVTNPVTRHPALTAASILSIHVRSGGRAILGIGRGDSSLGHIGLGPAPLKQYERYVRQVQAYLAGHEVDQAGFPSRIHWLPDDHSLPKVPLDMSCSGRKSISLAAAVADRVTFAVGADHERVSWALATARSAAAEAGRDPATIKFGAWINCVALPQPGPVPDAMKASIAAFAHFSSGQGTDFDQQPAILRRVTEPLATGYDTREHVQARAQHTKYLDDEFLEWFAVAGPPDYIIERLRPLIALGLNHLYFVGSAALPSRELFAKHVLPGLRA